MIAGFRFLWHDWPLFDTITLQSCQKNTIVPKKVTEQELRNLLQIIRSLGDRVSVGQLMALHEVDQTRRTLQRRLEHLCERGDLQALGEGRGRRYAIKPKVVYNITQPKPSMVFDEPEEPKRGWLSDESLEIKRLIERPQAERNPVGYHHEFLGDYIPNESYYLPDETRKLLARKGEVGVSDLPAGTYFRQVLDRLLIELSWNSSRLEGNTYSLLDTKHLLELGEIVEGRESEETQMILNHKAAIEMLAEQAEEIAFNRYTICNVHALLADNLLPEQASCGRLRSVGVGISGTVFHPLANPQLIEERFMEILEKAEAIQDPFEKAFFAMVHFPYLQPFEDVNKRVSRLAANIPLVRHNLCPLSFVDVSPRDYVTGMIGIYELNRIDYLRDVFVWAYQRSAGRYSAVVQSLGEPDPFRLRYRIQITDFVKGVVIGGLDKRQAAKAIAQRASEEIEAADRAQFIGVVETELTSLHEGNIMRHRLRPSEFEPWFQKWDGMPH